MGSLLQRFSPLEGLNPDELVSCIQWTEHTGARPILSCRSESQPEDVHETSGGRFAPNDARIV
jgi:hypothetical protein